MSIKVIVAGFKGRMGSTAVEMVKGDDELTLAALLDPFAAEKEVDGVQHSRCHHRHFSWFS